MEEGKCVIVSAPSGSGKTTIVHHLLGLELGLEFSVSACSREQREAEIEGKDYYFMAVDEFKKKIEANEFIEWEEVYPDHFYGTLGSEIDRIWQNGKTVIFDVDVVGGLNLKKIFGDLSLAVFIVTPSIADLEERLKKRSTESPERIAERLDKAAEEIKRAGEFDKIVVNDDLAHAKNDAEQIVREFLNIPVR